MLPNESWVRLEKATALKVAIEDASVIFASDTDALAKQKKLKMVMKAYGLAQSLFQAVDMEIGSDTDSDDANEVIADTRDALEQVMRLEFENATRLLTTGAWTQAENNTFLASDRTAVLALTRAKAQLYYQKHVRKSMNADKNVRFSTSMQAELITLEETVLKQSRVVQKAKKLHFLRDRQHKLESPKQCENDCSRPAASSAQPPISFGAPFATQQCAGIERTTYSPSSPPPISAGLGTSKRRRNENLNLAASSTETLPSFWARCPKKHCAEDNAVTARTPNSRSISAGLLLHANISAPISPRELIQDKITDAIICVKLFYVPHDITTFLPQPAWNTTSTSFDLFESKVGVDGEEYTLIAKGKTATKALKLLKEWAGKVVTLRRIRRTSYRNSTQLELLEDFEILAGIDTARKEDLQRQQIKRYSLTSIAHEKHGARLALLPCVITSATEIKHDKHGKPFRATQVTDEDGVVANIMIWGTLAEADHLWQNGTVIEMMAAYINHTQERVDLRNSSQALLSGNPAEFKRLTERLYETCS